MVMGCNCKKKTQTLNNTNSKDYLLLAVEIYDSMSKYESTSDFTDLDWVWVYQVYNSLYPNSSVKPTKEDAWNKIVQARNTYIQKFVNKTKTRK